MIAITNAQIGHMIGGLMALSTLGLPFASIGDTSLYPWDISKGYSAIYLITALAMIAMSLRHIRGIEVATAILLLNCYVGISLVTESRELPDLHWEIGTKLQLFAYIVAVIGSFFELFSEESKRQKQ